MSVIKVNEGQNLMDVSIQHLGDMTGVFALAKLNNISITDHLTPGTELKLPPIINPDLVYYLADKNVIPATSDSAGVSTSTPDGIDFMEIENTFIVA